MNIPLGAEGVKTERDPSSSCWKSSPWDPRLPEIHNLMAHSLSRLPCLGGGTVLFPNRFLGLMSKLALTRRMHPLNTWQYGRSGWVQQPTLIMAIKVDGCQLFQLRLDIGRGQGPPARTSIRVPSNRNSPTIVLRLGISWTENSNDGISHIMVVVDHINDNFFHTTLEDKVAYTRMVFLSKYAVLKTSR